MIRCTFISWCARGTLDSANDRFSGAWHVEYGIILLISAFLMDTWYLLEADGAAVGIVLDEQHGSRRTAGILSSSDAGKIQDKGPLYVTRRTASRAMFIMFIMYIDNFVQFC
jgi:hypothetical protein